MITRHDNSILPVSIIIPVFNDEAGLSACLRGIANQNYPMNLIQVVIADNASSPPIQIVNKHPFEIRLTQCIKPGSYAARNVGAKAATSNILAFTDADCVPDPEWLKQGIRRLAGC